MPNSVYDQIKHGFADDLRGIDHHVVLTIGALVDLKAQAQTPRGISTCAALKASGGARLTTSESASSGCTETRSISPRNGCPSPDKTFKRPNPAASAPHGAAIISASTQALTPVLIGTASPRCFYCLRHVAITPHPNQGREHNTRQQSPARRLPPAILTRSELQKNRQFNCHCQIKYPFHSINTTE